MTKVQRLQREWRIAGERLRRAIIADVVDEWSRRLGAGIKDETESLTALANDELRRLALPIASVEDVEKALTDDDRRA